MRALIASLAIAITFGIFQQTTSLLSVEDALFEKDDVRSALTRRGAEDDATTENVEGSSSEIRDHLQKFAEFWKNAFFAARDWAARQYEKITHDDADEVNSAEEQRSDSGEIEAAEKQIEEIREAAAAAADDTTVEQREAMREGLRKVTKNRSP